MKTATAAIAERFGAGKRQDGRRWSAMSVRWNAGRKAIDLKLDDGTRLRLPKSQIPELQGTDPGELEAISLSSDGREILLGPDEAGLDVHDLVVRYELVKMMVASVRGTARTAPTATARPPAAKGGKPRKTPPDI